MGIAEWIRRIIKRRDLKNYSFTKLADSIAQEVVEGYPDPTHSKKVAKKYEDRSGFRIRIELIEGGFVIWVNDIPVRYSVEFIEDESVEGKKDRLNYIA